MKGMKFSNGLVDNHDIYIENKNPKTKLKVIEKAIILEMSSLTTLVTFSISHHLLLLMLGLLNSNSLLNLQTG